MLIQTYPPPDYAAVMYTDHNIGMVLDTLEASGVKEETVVAIMGVRNPSRRLSAPSYSSQLIGCRCRTMVIIWAS